jgi:hypothetical protein
MMWAWVIGVFSGAAVVNQSAIALFRRAQADTEPDVHQRCRPNCGLGDDTGLDASPAPNCRPQCMRVRD